MRRLVVSLIAATAFVATAQPASAAHNGTQCDHIGYNALDHARVCLTVNEKVPTIDIEGLAWFDHAPDAGVRVQFDWVHLYRWPDGTNGQDDLIRWTGGPSNWLSQGESYSTNWAQYNCNNTYQTRAKWRVKRPNNTVTEWTRSRSHASEIC